jgi:hypothetical protein
MLAACIETFAGWHAMSIAAAIEPASLCNEILLDEKRHRRRAVINSLMHQILVILAACAGFGALAAGLMWPDKGWIAGIMGAVPSFASVLILRLHCVRSANWHNRKAHELEGVRYRLQFEGEDIVVASREVRAIKERLLSMWERTTANDELTDTSAHLTHRDAASPATP